MKRRDFMQTLAGLPILSSGASGALELPPQTTLSDAAPISVGSRKQLFIDRKFIESSRGIRLVVNPPVKTERVLLPEMPWESHCIQAYHTVMEHDGVYKLWYDAIAGSQHNPSRSTCYATSHDGIHWERPNVHQFVWEGIQNNNIVMPGAVGSVMIDPNGPDEQRFKALMLIWENTLWPDAKGVIGGEYNGKIFLEVYLCTSPDGIRWRRQATPALVFFHDTQNQFFFDTRLKKYVAYVRTAVAGRTVGRTEFDDPMKLPWPFKEQPNELRGPDLSRHAVGGEFLTALSRDESDPPDTDFYTPCVVQYPWAGDAYFSFPSIYRHFPYGNASDTTQQGKDERGHFKNDGPLEIQLAASRDGKFWSRPDRQPFVRLGLKGSWDGGTMYMAIGMLRKGAEIWQYYSGTHFTHGAYDPQDAGRSGGICRLVQRLDGFMSADADYTGAELVTPLLTFSGTQLKLNVDCSATGQVWVEILDDRNNPIPGYRMKDALGVEQNEIAASVRWKEHENVGELADRPVRLHFKLRGCKLYAFQFEA